MRDVAIGAVHEPATNPIVGDWRAVHFPPARAIHAMIVTTAGTPGAGRNCRASCRHHIQHPDPAPRIAKVVNTAHGNQLSPEPPAHITIAGIRVMTLTASTEICRPCATVGDGASLSPGSGVTFIPAHSVFDTALNVLFHP